MTDTFFTTRWSVVAAAGESAAAPRARAALADLCAAYWPPLYAHARCSGAAAQDAADLVQGFLARLIEKGDLARLDPARGRFRAWLVVAFRNYVANERDRERAGKRGGGRAPLSLDAPRIESDAAEALCAAVLVDERTPERAYERRWALTVLQRALDRLSAEQARAGKAAAFERLRPWLTAGGADEPQADVAAALGLSAGAVKVAIHRLRRRYGELLRDEVAGTLQDPAEIEDELAALRAALAD